MTHPAEAVLNAFYKQALTFQSGADTTEILERVLAKNFHSQNNHETKDKAALIRQFEGLRHVIPDLKFEPRQKVIEGHTIVIRSIASGTPNGPFMGVQTDGSKTFQIDTIDIHTVENGQIIHVYHVEDWASAIRQVTPG